MTQQVAIRLPETVVQQIDDLVPAHYPTRSDAIRAILEQTLYRMACARDAEIYASQPLTDSELVFTDSNDALSPPPEW